MRKSTSSSSKLFLAASVALAGVGVWGCSSHSVADKDAPGGVMSGTEYERNRNTRGSGVDVSSRGGSIGMAHTAAGAGGAGGTTPAGPSGASNSSSFGAVGGIGTGFDTTGTVIVVPGQATGTTSGTNASTAAPAGTNAGTNSGTNAGTNAGTAGTTAAASVGTSTG